MSDDTSKLLKACVEYRAMVDKLEAENAELRRDVYQCPPTSENDYEGFKWNDACDELERENAALREDKERLDWVIKDSYYHFFFKLSSDLEKGRRQIDAARKEAQP